MPFSQPEEIADDFPVPPRERRKGPIATYLLIAGLMFLIALLALAY